LEEKGRFGGRGDAVEGAGEGGGRVDGNPQTQEGYILCCPLLQLIHFFTGPVTRKQKDIQLDEASGESIPLAALCIQSSPIPDAEADAPGEAPVAENVKANGKTRASTLPVKTTRKSNNVVPGVSGHFTALQCSPISDTEADAPGEAPIPENVKGKGRAAPGESDRFAIVCTVLTHFLRTRSFHQYACR
jgi:hypothetical protein